MSISWRYPDDVGTGDVTGYTIHATDGEIGKVDKANNETDSNYLIVTTGPWIFGKTVMLPAGVITRVDRENETVHVGLTKEQMKTRRNTVKARTRRNLPRRPGPVLRHDPEPVAIRRKPCRRKHS